MPSQYPSFTTASAPQVEHQSARRCQLAPLILLTMSLFFGLPACESDLTDTQYPNVPPTTYLANIPPPNDTTAPYPYRLTFSWDGGDDDGVVVGFWYRWDAHDWTYTTERSRTFDFESPDILNRHTFEVRAVDNDDAVDPTPESRTFHTARTLLPHTELIAGPAEEASVFCLPQPTETWKGITFTLGGTDDDGIIVGFEYAIDDSTQWQSVSGYTVSLAGLTDGHHAFYAKAVDNAGGKDTNFVRRSFTSVQPTFADGILLVNETRDGSGASGSPTRAEVERFYSSIMSANGRSFTAWHRPSEGPPAPSDLAKYSLVFWYADDRSEQLLKQSVDVLREYLMVGGKLWLSGWRVIPELDNFTGSTSHTYSPGEFGYDVIGLETYQEQPDLDFDQARGETGYPGLHVDPAKLPTSFGGKLNFVGTVSSRDTKVIYTFGSSKNSTFAGHVCLVEYLGATYSVVLSGFPLYFLVETEVSVAMGQILSDIGE